MTYVSSTSMDSAIQQAGDDPLVINSPVIQNSEVIFDSDLHTGYKGKLEWKDDKGNVYPLAGAKVSVKVKSSGSSIFPLYEVKSVYTDSDGNFDLEKEFPNAVFNTLTLSLSNQFVSIYHVDNTDTETVGFDSRTSLYEMGLNKYISDFRFGKPLIVSSTTQNGFGSEFGQAVQIFEAMHYYSQYARNKIKGNDLTLCNVNYPCAFNYLKKNDNGFASIGAPFYNKKYQTIYLPTNKRKNINSPLAVYQSYDAIGHEYGHHIGNITGYCKANVGGQHNSAKDDVRTIAGVDSTTQEQVNQGLTLAWLESWPTYWSQIAQESFPKNIKEGYGFIADQTYDAYNFSGRGYSIVHNENFPSERENNACGGDAFERGIMRFLYETNRAIGGYSSINQVSVDFLWDLLKASNDWRLKTIQTIIRLSDIFMNIYMEK